MQRSTVRMWISLVLLLTLVFLPSAVFAQDDPPDKDEVAEEMADEADLSPEEAAALDEGGEVEVEPEPGEGEMEGGEVEPEPGEGEMAGEEGAAEEAMPGEGAAAEGGAAEGSEGDAPDYLPVTGGEHNATYLVVLAVLALLFTGAYATRRFQHN